MKRNAIVLCCTASYIPYATVTLFSCKQHGGSAIADLHLVVPDSTPEDQQKFENFAEKNSLNVNFHSVTLEPSAHELDVAHLGIGTVVRLYLETWISPDYDRVLYLDSDIIALGPIESIFSLDLGGRPLAAVEDYMSFTVTNGIPIGQAIFDSLGMLPNAKYFNAGVLIMDWKAICQEQRLRSAVQTGLRLKSEGKRVQYADQDILNVEFQSDWTPIDFVYNLFGGRSVTSPVIFRHFAGPDKPWDQEANGTSKAYGHHYRTALKDSPWPIPKQDWVIEQSDTSSLFSKVKELGGRLLKRFR